MSHPRRIVWFCNTHSLARRPDDLARLRDAIGLTTIMPESGICHTSGFSASAALAARSPFADWADRADRYPKAAEGIFPPVAGVIGGFDDADLRCVIEAAQKAGIEVWGHLGLWSYGGEVYPEFALRDVDGRPLDRRYERWGIGLCPSQPEVEAWTADGLVDVAKRYEMGGFCVDHARYPLAANVHALAACGCPHCRAAGTRLGFDAEALLEGVRQTRDILARLTPAAVTRALDGGRTGLALLQDLGVEADIEGWLRMRAAILAERMAGYAARMRAVRPDWVFGSDVFAPTVALLGGHDYGGWEDATDYLTGGSSAGGVVGWATGATSTAAEWATTLMRQAPQIVEADAVRLALALLDAAMEGLPQRIDGLLDPGQLPIEALYRRELGRLLAATSGRVPRYPPIAATGDCKRVRDLCAAVREAGCDGAMVSLDPDREEVLAAIREGLGPLAG